MTPEFTIDLRQKILQLCHASGEYGMPRERLYRNCRNAGGFSALTEEGFQEQIEFLEGKLWIKRVENEMEELRWETTAAGDQYLRKQGLI